MQKPEAMHGLPSKRAGPCQTPNNKNAALYVL